MSGFTETPWTVRDTNTGDRHPSKTGDGRLTKPRLRPRTKDKEMTLIGALVATETKKGDWNSIRFPAMISVAGRAVFVGEFDSPEMVAVACEAARYAINEMIVGDLAEDVIKHAVSQVSGNGQT